MKEYKNRKLITLAHSKGGVSKTTIATNLAVALKRMGYKIKVLDLDTLNTSSSIFFDNREDIECELINTIEDLSRAVEFDGIILSDSAGYDVETTRAIITASDAVLIPFNPRSDKDIGGLINFMDTIDEIRAIPGTTLDTYFIPSMLHHSSILENVVKPLQPILERGYKIAGTTTRRVSYETSGDKSQDVKEHGDERATIEIENIINTILKDKKWD